MRRAAAARACARAALPTHVQTAADLALAAQLDVDALVQAQPDEVERLLDGGVVDSGLCRHLCCASFGMCVCSACLLLLLSG